MKYFNDWVRLTSTQVEVVGEGNHGDLVVRFPDGHTEHIPAESLDDAPELQFPTNQN